MKRIWIILFLLLLSSPSIAADNAVILTPGAGVTMRCKDVGALVQSCITILGDTSGNPILGTAGASNANVLSVQGIAGGTGLPITIAGTVTISAANISSASNQLLEITSLNTLAGGVTSSVYQSNTKQVNGVTTLAGAGAVGTGSQRIAIGQDATTIGGSAPGTAGTPSSNVITIQGIAGGTTISISGSNLSTATNQATEIASLATIATNSGLPIPAGTNKIGTVDPATSASWGLGATSAAVPANAIFAGARSGANLVGIIQADTTKQISMSSATTTEMVALSGSTKIYATSYDIIAGGTTNVTFVYGTGSNCGTGTTSLAGLYALTAQAGIAKGSGLGPVLVVPAGNALCVINSASVAIGGSLSYTQF